MRKGADKPVSCRASKLRNRQVRRLSSFLFVFIPPFFCSAIFQLTVSPPGQVSPEIPFHTAPLTQCRRTSLPAHRHAKLRFRPTATRNFASGPPPRETSLPAHCYAQPCFRQIVPPNLAPESVPIFLRTRLGTPSRILFSVRALYQVFRQGRGAALSCLYVANRSVADTLMIAFWFSSRHSPANSVPYSPAKNTSHAPSNPCLHRKIPSPTTRPPRAGGAQRRP